MPMGPYANLEVYEAELDGNGTRCVDFNLKPKEVIITNDSPTDILEFRFNASEQSASLAPTETVVLRNVSIREILLDGPQGVPYRIWGIG